MRRLRIAVVMIIAFGAAWATSWLAVDRPRRFVDEQVRGPFRRFHHEHVFEPRGSGTVMIDRVSFDAPLGPLGWAAERVALAGYMCRLIEKRASLLKVAAERQPRT